jgi:hypothetical protein
MKTNRFKDTLLPSPTIFIGGKNIIFNKKVRTQRRQKVRAEGSNSGLVGLAYLQSVYSLTNFKLAWGLNS